MTADGLESRLRAVAQAERGYPHALRAGLPVVAMHFGPPPVRGALEAIEGDVAVLEQIGALRERVVDTAERGTHRSAPALEKLRELVARSLGAATDPERAAEVATEVRKIVDDARAAIAARTTTANGRQVERYSDEELNEITPNGAGVRVMLARLASMDHADFLVAHLPEEARKLAELLRELPDSDRWFEPPLTWHSRRERPQSIVVTLCDHVAACAADRTMELRRSEVLFALQSVAGRVAARRVAPVAAAIEERAAREIEAEKARVRRELGLG